MKKKLQRIYRCDCGNKYKFIPKDKTYSQSEVKNICSYCGFVMCYIPEEDYDGRKNK